MKKNVTLNDIAQKLNVSVGLVSLVLRGKWKENRISEEMAKKVNKAAKDLGYKPNAMAQALRTGKSKIIGLIVADIANPFYGKIARIIENEAYNKGYQVIFGSSDEDLCKFEKVVEAMKSRQVDGLLVVPVIGSHEVLQAIQESNIPTISIDRYLTDAKLPYVVTDNYKGSYDIGLYLQQKGYQNIAFITKESPLSNFIERNKGFEQSMKDTGINYQKHALSVDNWNEELVQLIRDMDTSKVDAIYFAQNMLAVEGLKTVNALHSDELDKLAIISFDNPEIFEINRPTITCYQQPLQVLAEKAVQELINSIESKQSKDISLKIEGKLIIRQSC
ncbi:LacI family transcriptional regulator [Prolixibacteraceae bacterium JC049]|nr:LacI family transcriptional regulator [Prolixibacteraceae bacterium JC049]